ncbi:MAG: sulfide:quinone oxidoreductase, partial [Chloroflexota bacterium]|nr:sulfide:quinone oxidoreductase [Chloroflexota bacterium]
LTDLGEHRFKITVVAPNERFSLRANTVSEPFAAGHHADVASLADVAREHGAELVRGTVTDVDTRKLAVLCSDGEELSADALVLSPGARARPAYAHALTFGLGDPLALNGVLADLEQGYSTSVAFVVPPGVVWSLPLYELALMTARQVYGSGRDVDLHLATPEPAPLAIFGPEASASVAGLFDELGIALHCGMPVAVGRGSIRIGPDDDGLAMDRIVSLPVLDGPCLPGVPATTGGFIAVDEFCRVPGLPGVYAIGDATDLLVKQGGLACQQADVVARHIAHEAGAPHEAEPFLPVLRGRLLTGGAEQFLRRDLQDVHGEVQEDALWWPPAKVYGHYLGPWVATQQLGHLPVEPTPSPPAGIDVEIPLQREHWLGPRALLGLDPLGALHS